MNNSREVQMSLTVDMTEKITILSKLGGQVPPEAVMAMTCCWCASAANATCTAYNRSD